MEWSEFFTALAAIGAAISAGVSLQQMFVQRKHEKEQQKTVNRISWYNKITLETIVPMLNEITDYATQHLSELNNKRLSDNDINCAKEIHKEVENKIRSVEEMLKLIELFDKNVYRDTSQSINEIREEYTKLFNKMLVDKFFVFYDSSIIHREKKKVLKVLLEGSTKLLE